MNVLSRQQLAEGIVMNTLADLLEAKEEGRDANQVAYFAALFTYACSEACRIGVDSAKLREATAIGCSQFEADDALPMACLGLIDASDHVESEHHANTALQAVLDGQI